MRIAIVTPEGTTTRNMTAAEVANQRTQWRKTASLSRPDFVNAAADLGMLTDAEAIAAAKGDWPASFDAAMSSLSAKEQRTAKVLWAGVTDVHRNADLIGLIIASSIPITATQVDTLFGYGG